MFDVAQIEKIRVAEGKVVKVRGLVERTGKSRGSGINFLNFPGGQFTAVVFAKSLKHFPDGEPADLFEGKLVEVSGAVTMYEGKPQIVLERPAQIVVLDPETRKPPPEPGDPAPPPEPDKPEPGAADDTGGPAPEVEDPEKVDPRLYFDDP